jgi:hypothetical protein
MDTTPRMASDRSIAWLRIPPASRILSSDHFQLAVNSLRAIETIVPFCSRSVDVEPNEPAKSLEY